MSNISKTFKWGKLTVRVRVENQWLKGLKAWFHVTLHAMMAMSDSQLFLLKYELDIKVYILEKWLFSVLVSLLKWLTHFYCRKPQRNY